MKTSDSIFIIFAFIFSTCSPTFSESTKGSSLPTPMHSIRTQVHPIPSTAQSTEQPIPKDWLLFEAVSHGFSVAYPPAFDAITDDESLYGWDNAVMLLYNGGQSYDIVFQVWDSMDEVEKFYGTEEERLLVFPLGAQFLSVMNITGEADSAEIINSISFQ